MQDRGRNRWPYVLLIVVLVCAAVGGWLWSRGRVGPGDDGFPPQLAQTQVSEQLALERGWSEAGWLGVSATAATAEAGGRASPEALASSWSGVVHDVESLVSEEQRGALAAALARFAHAYGAETADEYIALVESTPWLVWRQDTTPLRAYLAYYADNAEAPAGATAADILRLVWPAMMLEHGMGWAEVGVGERGAVVIIEKTYADQPGNGLGALNLTEEEYEHWDGGPMHGYFHNFTWTSPDLAPPADADADALGTPRSAVAA
ncbi:MAG: hypothetical protein D6693_04950, partial [Planctomycetota bacterium]